MATLETSTKDGVFIVSVTGYFGMDIGAKFREVVKDQIDRGIRKLLIDLRNGTGMDSTGVGNLVIAYTQMANSGGQLALIVPPTGKINDTLHLTKIFSVFRVFDSVDGAVQDLAKTKTA